MKKLLSLLVALAMCFSLAACSIGSKSGNVDKEETTVPLSPGEKNTVDGYAEFTLFKIKTSDRASATKPGGSYYENTISGETYIDIILDWNNTSSKSISSEDVATASAVNSSGKTYKASFYATENNDHSWLSQLNSIEPGETVRLHCVLSVPETETQLTLKLTVKDAVYTYDYTLGEVVGTAKKITVGDTIEEPDYANLSLVKIATGKTVSAPMAGGNYYENNSNGETYIDIIFDVTNTSSNAISSEDIVFALANNSSGTEYSDYFVLAEKDHGTRLRQYDDIAPLSTVRVHCVLSVPETETQLTLRMGVNGNEYACDYTLGEVTGTTHEIKIGDTLEAADFATFTFTGIEYTDDLLPSDTSRVYTHYEVDNPSNTYLVVKFDVTSYLSSARDHDTFVGIKVVYMDKYNYRGFLVVEDEDRKGFDSYADIDPLTTRQFFYLVEVPKTVVGNEFTLTFHFNGQEYAYTGK